MINIKGGPLWQWSIGRKVIITPKEGYTVNKVEFFNGLIDHAVKGTLETEDDGTIVAIIPPQLLQYAISLTVYAVSANADLIQTTESVTFVVNRRARPEDYIFTNEEIRTWQEHEQHLAQLEKAKDDIQKEIKDAYNGYDGTLIEGTNTLKPTLFASLGAAIRTQIESLFALKVSLPRDVLGKAMHGFEGQVATSDGKGGIKFIDTNADIITDKTLTKNGHAADAYETGRRISDVESKVGTITGESFIVTGSDIAAYRYWDYYVDTSNIQIGAHAMSALFGLDSSLTPNTNSFIFQQEIQKGDKLLLNQGYYFVPYQNATKFIVADKNDIVIDVVALDSLSETLSYTFTEDGTFYVCAGKSNIGSGNLFEIWKNTVENKIKELSTDLVVENSISLKRQSNSTVGQYSTALGVETTSSGQGSHAEGIRTVSSGQGSHAEGRNTEASGTCSHAEGLQCKATNAQAHAEGNRCTASGTSSHAEGWNTKATGECAHAEGKNGTASGEASHTEGMANVASGQASHAEGQGVQADGDVAHAEGCGTLASGLYQHVQGKYNIEDRNGQYAHIVGGGTSSESRANIHTLDWNGNAVFAGNITFKMSDGQWMSLSDMVARLLALESK